MRFSINAPTAKDSAWRLIDTVQNPQSSNVALASSTASVAAPAASASAGVVQGHGRSHNDTCSCSCFCGVGTFPAGAGIGMMGGVAGSIPVGSMSAPNANANVGENMPYRRKIGGT